MASFQNFGQLLHSYADNIDVDLRDKSIQAMLAYFLSMGK